MTVGDYLSDDNIKKLLESPLENKKDVTNKIATFYDTGGFSQQQKNIAEEIFRVLLRDTEVEVRKTLSEAIKNSDKIPKDVVLKLANDVKEVSIPVLEFSEVLTDKDLIEIIRTTNDEDIQKTVSKRDNVSVKLSDALIDTRSEIVVEALLNNKTANISEQALDDIVNNYSDKKRVIESLVFREKLPMNIIENITKKVSQQIINQLEEKHGSSINKITEAVKNSQNITTMKVAGLKVKDDDYYHFCELMKQMQIDEKLIPISALCIGNLKMFEVCIARKLKTPVLNVRTILSDESNKGFKVIYERAELPESLYHASETLIDVLRLLNDDLKDVGCELSKPTANKIITNLMMSVEEKGKVDNIDYIVTLIRHHAGLNNTA